MQNKQIVKVLYEYQLTKRCLEGRLECFKVSSWFLRVMKVVEYRIAKIFIIVVDGCIITIHEVITCDSTLMKQSYTVRNIPKFKDRASWSRNTFQPMRRRACVYQQTNQNIAPVLKNFQNNRRSRRTELKMSLQYSSRFHVHLIFQRKHFM